MFEALQVFVTFVGLFLSMIFVLPNFLQLRMDIAQRYMEVINDAAQIFQE